MRFGAEILRLKWSEGEALWRIRDMGLISDNCASLDEVADADARRVREWLESRSRIETGEQAMLL